MEHTDSLAAIRFIKAIGRRAHALRMDANYTLRYVAQRTGHTTRYLSKVERGHAPTILLTTELARLYGVPFLYFYTGDGLGRMLKDPIESFKRGEEHVKSTVRAPRGRAVPTNQTSQ